LVVAIAYAAYSGDETMSDRIDAQVRRSGELNLNKATDFEWDSVYIFGPYTGRESVCGKLSAIWSECDPIVPAYVAESGYLFVFTNGGPVVKHEWHLAWNGTFCEKVLGVSIASKDAMFNSSPDYKTGFGTQVFKLCMSGEARNKERGINTVPN
jgi:hypothetical protein